MIVSVPSSALGRDPVTGASRKPMPRSLRRPPMAREAVGAMVDMSMQRPPSAIPAPAPSSPKRTASTWGVSGTIEIAVPASRAAWAGVGAALAPNSAANRSVLAASRVQTLTSKPARARLAAIGRPMMPKPRNATRSALAMSAISFGSPYGGGFYRLGAGGPPAPEPKGSAMSVEVPAAAATVRVRGVVGDHERPVRAITEDAEAPAVLRARGARDVLERRATDRPPLAGPRAPLDADTCAVDVELRTRAAAEADALADGRSPVAHPDANPDPHQLGDDPARGAFPLRPVARVPVRLVAGRPVPVRCRGRGRDIRVLRVVRVRVSLYLDVLPGVRGAGQLPAQPHGPAEHNGVRLGSDAQAVLWGLGSHRDGNVDAQCEQECGYDVSLHISPYNEPGG